jgi:hypothetical protein
LDNDAIVKSHAEIGRKAFVFYMDPTHWGIPNSRERQITLSIHIEIFKRLFRLDTIGAIAMIDKVFTLFDKTLAHLKAAFAAAGMIPPSSFILPAGHQGISEAMDSLESKKRRMDDGILWRDPTHIDSHPAFFKRMSLTYNFADTKAADIPIDVALSRSYRWFTHREKSCAGAIAHLLSQQAHDKGEYTFDPSPELGGYIKSIRDVEPRHPSDPIICRIQWGRSPTRLRLRANGCMVLTCRVLGP